MAYYCRSTVDGPLVYLRTALTATDFDAIRAAHATVMQASQAFSQKLYEKASANDAAGTSASGAGTGSSGTAGGGDDEIIDAEIVDEGQPHEV